jgi:tetratricopeptide (TPR) repeat protein/tryptophan-rich sensory protein
MSLPNNPDQPAVAARPKRPKWVPPETLTPALWVLLFLVFSAVAVLGASGAYLGSVSLLDWVNRARGVTYSTTFTLWMFLAHGIVGVLVLVPFVVFGVWHFKKGSKLSNKAAIRRGLWLFALGLVIGVTGLALFQFEGLPQLATGTLPRSVVYWLHVVVPVASVFVYVAHRRKGPAIRWKYAKMWGLGVAAFVGGMTVLHSMTPQRWFAEGPKDGEKYFHPSSARTADGKFIPADLLMSDTYCMQCHQEIYNDHLHSAHKFSSFNNPAYLASVKETRDYAQLRDGNVQASRWCAGCHDPAPFFSGAFDDPKFDMANHPTAHAGVTCVSCHAITHVHDTTGNGAYTIEASNHYPFAFSSNSTMRALSNQMIKAKPDVHKKTFLKSFHKSADFCSTCHKVSLPAELNHYKDFLRGQNHHDSYHLSGASGRGARSFYYPAKAFENCASCHMNLKEVVDIATNFGAKDFDGSGKPKNHNHLFPAANTGLPTILKDDPRYKELTPGLDKAIKEHTDFLTGVDPDGKDKRLRIDLFGLKPGVTTEADKLQVIRPTLPVLEPGQTYTVEAVIRTLVIGHHFSQGTVDSNEIWVDFRATANGKEIARSGGMAGPDDTGEVDRWAHYVNVHMLDRNGNRINRRNPQDIFTPFYDKQIPPGAANVVRYRLDVPKDVAGPVELSIRVRYRKFDQEYMDYVSKQIGRPMPTLPIVDMCADKVTLPVKGVAEKVPEQTSPIKAGWQRWNDYGIAHLIEGGAGNKRGHFRQAEAAFQKLVTLNIPEATGNGHMNLARVYIDEGRLDEAAKQLDLAGKVEPAVPWWTRAWLNAVVNSENATKPEDLDKAIADLERIVNRFNQPTDRGFDFTQDYVIWNLLANRLFKRRQFEAEGSDAYRRFVERSIEAAEQVLKYESEDVQAHDQLKQSFDALASEKGIPTLTLDKLPTIHDVSYAALGLTDANAAKAHRLTSARMLLLSLQEASKLPPNLDSPKLPAMRALYKSIRPAFDTPDPELKAAAAAVLSAMHREFHLIYKPDEIARSTARQIYGQKNPAANYAARDRVIYPTTAAHRDKILKTGELQ